MRVFAVTSWIAVAVAVALPVPASAADPLPEGDQGLAANHPNDEGLGEDPQVFLFEDFESYADANALWDRWDNVYQLDQIRFATEPENVFAGAQSIEFTVPPQDAELSNSLDKAVSPEREVFFLRYYSKFSAPFEVVGSSHNGSSISAHYFIDGQATPGVPADGMNKFLVAYENWRGEDATPTPGNLNVYVYHPEQRDNFGDHFFPTGVVLPNTSKLFDFGPDFVPYPDVIQELDRWYCYEFMVQANTPGVRDGRIAFWLDGVLAADFVNLRLRDVASLTIDRFGLGLHIGSNPNGEQKKWYDNIVAADAYVGPRFVPGSGDSGGEGDTSAGDGSASATQGSEGSASAGTEAGSATTEADAGTQPGEGSTTEAAAGDDGSGGCACTVLQTPWQAALGWIGLIALAGGSTSRRRRSGE